MIVYINLGLQIAILVMNALVLMYVSKMEKELKKLSE